MPDTIRRGNLMRREPNDFWNYSLKLYGVAAVADACLSLQDRAQADVNILLFCCWQGSLGHALTTRSLRQAIESVAVWQRQVILPLRRVRRVVKAEIAAIPLHRQQQLRRRVAAAELDAEYLEQLMLAQCVADIPRAVAKDTPAAVIAGNLRRYVGLLNLPSEPSMQSQLGVLRTACRSHSTA